MLFLSIPSLDIVLVFTVILLQNVSSASVGSENLQGSPTLVAIQAQEEHNSSNVDTWDGFISYRRSVSRHLAMLIKIMLQGRNISGYLDVEDLEGGDWDSQLMESIELAPNFILVLGNGTLERCKGDFNYTDFLHREIKSAVDLDKRIILVLDEFDWPPNELFSPEINAALANQGIVWQHHLAEQSLDRLIRYMIGVGVEPKPSNPEGRPYDIEALGDI